MNHSFGSAGIRQGIDEDDLIAAQLGKAKAEQLSDVQQKYKDKIKQRLAEVYAVHECNTEVPSHT